MSRLFLNRLQKGPGGDDSLFNLYSYAIPNVWSPDCVGCCHGEQICNPHRRFGFCVNERKRRREKCKWHGGLTCIFLPHFLRKSRRKLKNVVPGARRRNLSIEPGRCEVAPLALPLVPDVLLKTAPGSDEVCNGWGQTSFTSNCGFCSGSQTVQNPPGERSRDSHGETHAHACTHTHDISPCMGLTSCYFTVSDGPASSADWLALL